MDWTILLIALGAVLPIAVAAITVLMYTRGLPGSGGIVRATSLGLAAGAVGGLLVSGLIVIAVLLGRAAR